jgi:hypothetical protein
MPNGHLVVKLKKLLEESDIHLYRTKLLTREASGKTVECIAWYDGNRSIEVALGGHTSGEELIHSVIHELCHMADYNEEAVDSGLDNAAYQSRALREKVGIAILDAFLE